MSIKKFPQGRKDSIITGMNKVRKGKSKSLRSKYQVYLHKMMNNICKQSAKANKNKIFLRMN